MPSASIIKFSIIRIIHQKDYRIFKALSYSATVYLPN